MTMQLKLWYYKWKHFIVHDVPLLKLNKKNFQNLHQHYFYDINPIFDLQKYVALSTKCKLDLQTRLRHKEPKKENDDERLGGIPITESPLCYGKFLFYNTVCN